MTPCTDENPYTDEKKRLIRVVLITALIAMPFLPGTSHAKDELTLRVNDAIGEPGGVVALVVRTYASRPVGQGQVCLRAGRAVVGGAEGPFEAVEGVEVFSKAGDALGVAGLEASERGQLVLLQFTSDSGSINRVDGPLAVIYVRLRENLRKGQRFAVLIDTEETLILDGAGNPIPIEGRSGRLTVRKTTAPFQVEAEGDKVVPGEVAELGVETFEPFALGSGQVGLRYDASVAGGRPIVRMDKRHGARRFAVDRSTPGLVVVSFVSRKGTLNTVPGQIISIRIPTSFSAPIGDRSRVFLDPELTRLFDPDGAPLRIKLERNQLVFEAD